MLSLPAAAAYIIDYVHREEKLAKLGKMKLFKILYLADWELFKKTNKSLLDIAWYRIQKGPALKINDWQDLCISISEKYGIENGWKQFINYPQVMFTPTKPFKIKISKKDKEVLDQAINKVIDTTAEMAAMFTYKTEPMQWLVAQETALGGTIQFREFYIRDQARVDFVNLAEKYKTGLVDIPEIVQRMGDDWTENNVVLFLEMMGADRDISNIGLETKEREKVLRKLLAFHNETGHNTLMTSKWVEDAVIASQRIEGIFVSPDAVVDENVPININDLNLFTT